MDGFPSESSEDESMTVHSPVEVSSVSRGKIYITPVQRVSQALELVEKKDKKIGQLTSSKLVFLL